VALDCPIHSPDFYTGDPNPAYRGLRRHDPVHWSVEKGGFWSLAKYEDIRWVSAHPELFSSAQGITIPEPGLTLVHEDSLIFTDPPRHWQLRRLISSGFTPRRIRILEPEMRRVVGEVLGPLEDGAVVEFAETVAAPLPTRIIAELLGAPSDDWERFRSWSDAVVGAADPDVELDALGAMAELHEYFLALVADRRRQRRSDIISELIDAEIDGEHLDDDDLYRFCWLLLIAGNETTRNLIALGTKALLDHPDQLRLLLDDPSLIPSAIEEILRWVTPVTHMARTATEDVTIRGTTIRKDQPVVMLYGSANRDEDVFGDDAEEFRITRSPNPHMAFGFGEHLCIGASLARLEARILFEELLCRFPRMEQAGPAVRMRSTTVPGVKHMPVRLRS
jgi:cytochrome P450